MTEGLIGCRVMNKKDKVRHNTMHHEGAMEAEEDMKVEEDVEDEDENVEEDNSML